ncbi:tyrosine-type recombinase/integrase [Kocuria marina]|uniref:tyrosine-type recombinase/integrase n=1 Tax=Kocuria marina TaxID=223184 RepID=UPI00155A7A98|nr:tyrosine-type recombinase/integrase [Kocuria marina]
MTETTQIVHRTVSAPNADTHGRLVGSWLASYPSANTRASYRVDARLFCKFLDTGAVDLLQASRAHVDVFARARNAAGDADTTLARRLAAVSAFYTYAITVGAVSKNPAQYVGRPSVDQDHTTTAALTRREAMRLLDAAVADSPRSHALVDLLLSTGVRISEALAATQAGLSSDRLVIRRKGGKKAVVALPEHTAAALYGLVGVLGTELATGCEADRLIFTTRNGRPWARSNAHTTLACLARKAGIIKPMSSHVLRHTHATLALELGVPLHHLQDSLGHADPRTTRRYDHSRKRLTNSSAHTVGQLFN